MPFQQHPYHANELQIVVRAEGDPTRLVPDVRARMHRLAPFVATRFTTFNEMLQDSMSAPRFRAALVSAFALLALFLAGTGVYGVMTYHVAEREAEMGVRMALGATSGSILSLVSKRAFVLGASGLLIGLAGSVALTELSATCCTAWEHSIPPLMSCAQRLCSPWCCSGRRYPPGALHA